MAHATRLIVVALAAILLAGCYPTAPPNPTGNTRCDRADVEPNELVNGQGYEFRCDPTFSIPNNGIGWADHKHLTVWLDTTQTPSDAVLAMIGYHEFGHVYAYRHGLTDTETSASEIGWCAGGWQIEGVGMTGWGPPPGGCATFVG